MEQAVGTVFGLLILAAIGFLIGAIAKSMKPGPDTGGWVATILLGIAGSWVGGFLAAQLGLGANMLVGIIAAVLGAVLLLVLYRLIVRTAWPRSPQQGRPGRRCPGAPLRRAI